MKEKGTRKKEKSNLIPKMPPLEWLAQGIEKKYEPAPEPPPYEKLARDVIRAIIEEAFFYQGTSVRKQSKRVQNAIRDIIREVASELVYLHENEPQILAALKQKRIVPGSE